jgi:hypothetical protein
LGNPLGFILTPGQAHDLQGADALLPAINEARPSRLSALHRSKLDLHRSSQKRYRASLHG